MTEDQKKAEVDAFLAEKDAMKRPEAGENHLGANPSAERGDSRFRADGSFDWRGAGSVRVQRGYHLPILGVVVALACAVGVNRWLGARRVNRQIAALKEYLDLRLVQIERGGAAAGDN